MQTSSQSLESYKVIVPSLEVKVNSDVVTASSREVDGSTYQSEKTTNFLSRWTGG
jgi:hypothetical protein